MEKPKLVQANQDLTITGDTKKNEAAKVETKAQPSKLIEKSDPNLLSQREAVFLEIMKVIREDKVVTTDKQSLKAVLSEVHLKKIYAALISGFRTSKIALKPTDANKQKLSDNKLMEVYVIGLVNNWVRRDNRLNGTLNTKK